MLKTLILIRVTITAVPIIIHLDLRRSGTITLIRLMIICSSSWTWIHHQNTTHVSNCLIYRVKSNDLTVNVMIDEKFDRDLRIVK